MLFVTNVMNGGMAENNRRFITSIASLSIIAVALIATISVLSSADHSSSPLQAQSSANGICSRTPQIRDEILRLTPGITVCADITSDHLEAITGLELSDKGISGLQSGDFAGLANMHHLYLDNNQLSSLPQDIFNGLVNLEVLQLEDNRLQTLPEDTFAGLTNLQKLRLFNNQLSSLPQDIFNGLANLSFLSLNGNQLSSLPQDIFTGLTNLKNLKLNGNQLASLPEDIFTGLTNLKNLKLNGNQLSSLPEDIFTGLTNLWFIDFRDNPISVLPSDREIAATSGSRSVWTLSTGESYSDISISERMIQVDEGNSVDFTVRLLSSQLGHDVMEIEREVKIQSSDDSKATASPTHLKYSSDWQTPQTVTISALQDANDDHESIAVTLSMEGTEPREVRVTIVDDDATPISGICDRTRQVRNEIVRLTPGVSDCAKITAAHLLAITVLDLSGKDITALQTGDFDGLFNLERLDLSNNRLTALPKDIFDGLVNLQHLDLSNNRLTVLPENIFAGLVNLQHLNLGDNQLTALPENIFAGLVNLQHLNLSDNQLTALPENIFAGLANLQHLDLSNNRLTVLPENIFKALVRLETLSLAGNQIVSLPENIFKQNPKLQRIDLRRNRLTQFKAQIVKGLIELEILQLQNNPVAESQIPTLREIRQVSGATGEIEFGKPEPAKILKEAKIGSVSPVVQTISIRAGEKVVLETKAYDKAGESNDALSSGVTFDWRDSSAGGSFAPQSTEGRTVTYTVPEVSGRYIVTAALEPGRYAECWGTVEECTASFYMIVSENTPTPVPQDPPGELPSIIIDGNGNEYKVFTPTRGGSFEADAFSFSAPPGAVANGEIIGVRMAERGEASNTGETHHRSFVGKMHEINVVRADGDPISAYQLHQPGEACVPVPPLMVGNLRTIVAADISGDTIKILSTSFRLNKSNLPMVCAGISSLPAILAVGQ